ncbi:MAG: helix-turn-helix transcriptional regulator [Flavobacteriales bacterium]|nr:helix-turn-helix transcriptional regulator [Flavobacteriales bacterium]
MVFPSVNREPELTYKRIGTALRELRLKAGYSSYENFAIDHDLSRRHYWETEKGRNISIEYLVKILAIHNMSIKEFFEKHF